MVRFALILMIGILLATATPARAGEIPTPTPPAAPSGPVQVVNDLNADGLLQEDEPGLAGWSVLAGCGDAFRVLETDVYGYVHTGVEDCVRVQRRFGWLPTSPVFLTADDQLSTPGPGRFFVHNLGPNVMELRGEAIVQGLPAVSPTFLSDVPFQGGTGGAGCGHAIVEESAVTTMATFIIEGADTRDDCPTPGAAMDIVMNEEPAARATFSPGTSEEADFVVAGDSMRLYLTDVDGAVVITGVSFFNHDCAVFRTGPQATTRVFVLSHEAKSGCAAPGNTVIFTRNGENLQPTVPWEAGTPEFSPPLQLVDIEEPETGGDIVTDVLPPDTGSGGLK